MENEKSHHEEIMTEIREINKKLDPIFDTYQAWLTFGRWGKIILYVVGAVLAILVGIKQIFK